MSAVLRCERKPHWFSGRRPCSRCWMRRLSGMRTKVLPAMNKREILSDCHKTAVSLPFVDVDYAGIFELLRDLPFIPRKLEYLCQFSHYDCATVQHGLCLVLALCHVRVFFFSWPFGLLPLWAAYQGPVWCPLMALSSIWAGRAISPRSASSQSEVDFHLYRGGGRSRELWSINGFQGIIEAHGVITVYVALDFIGTSCYTMRPASREGFSAPFFGVCKDM